MSNTAGLSEEKQIPMEQQQLLSDIKEALQHMQYTSATSGFNIMLAPHQLYAITEALGSVVDKFFEENLIQSKRKIWRD